MNEDNYHAVITPLNHLFFYYLSIHYTKDTCVFVKNNMCLSLIVCSPDTAFCKSPSNGRWHRYDDHEVYDLQRSEIKVCTS